MNDLISKSKSKYESFTKDPKINKNLLKCVMLNKSMYIKQNDTSKILNLKNKIDTGY
jgi:hypothetical protein